jgi:imidazole glycerol phosphate synthase glutamine amidotransferase subunit
MNNEVLVVSTGTANTASVLAGLRRAGAQPVLANDPEAIAQADRVVLPGVGAFKAAMNQLNRDGLTEVLCTRIAEGRPTLAICLGLQLLCERSEESLGTAGLGVIKTDVRQIAGSVRVPQMGWNLIKPDSGCQYLRPGYAYFANSYCLNEVPDTWQTARTNYGASFVSAVEQGDVLACQFHPELSGAWGADLLKRWYEGKPMGGESC